MSTAEYNAAKAKLSQQELVTADRSQLADQKLADAAEQLAVAANRLRQIEVREAELRQQQDEVTRALHEVHATQAQVSLIASVLLPTCLTTAPAPLSLLVASGLFTADVCSTTYTMIG